nr:retrovirus-related Pol polyprotein from transposon TNT 1-94 [Tanacetum cinerariifolium]
MNFDKYLEGQPMQRPSLFESDSFIYWKNRFNTYVKSKDLDLWHVIINGDFQPNVQNLETKLDEVIPFKKQTDDLKKRLAKNKEAKMVIYNALPSKEYERIFMCNTEKEIWKTLLITHQGNSQVKDNKIDLLIQQYEQFVISEDRSIDSAFTRFNTIITSLKSLDEGYSSKNYLRKFLRALHLKWKAKVTTIEESKDLTSLSLDELIGNFKVHEIIIKKDSKIVNAKVERKSIALKAKKQSSDEVCSTSGSEDEEYAMVVRDFKKFFKRRRGFMWRPESSYWRMSKTSERQEPKIFCRRILERCGKEDDEKVKDETCLVVMHQDKYVTIKCRVTFSEHNSEITKDGKVIGDESWIVAMQEELNQFIANDVWELVSQPKNMTIIGTKWVFRNKFDENGNFSGNKARLVSQGYNKQEGIDYDETYAPVARLESIRILLTYACDLDFKLFRMDVKSAFLNGFINEEAYVAQPLGFIDFKKPNHVYKLKKALYGLKQARKACFNRLKAFLIKHKYKMGMVDDTLFTKKKSLNLIIV